MSQMRKQNFLGLFCLVAALAGCSKEAPQQSKTALDMDVVKVAQNMVFDDHVSALTGGESSTPKERAMHNFNITQAVEASKLAQDYDANEVAADQKYKVKGSYLMVTGTVSGINKDFKGDPYVSLGGHKMLFDVQARFGKDSQNELVAMKKGQKVTFVCEVSNKIVTQVMLANCATIERHTHATRKNIDAFVFDVLTGKAKATKEGAQLISIAFVTAQRLPKNSSCMKTIDDACEAQFASILKMPGLEAEYKAFAATLQGSSPAQ